MITELILIFDLQSSIGSSRTQNWSLVGGLGGVHTPPHISLLIIFHPKVFLYSTSFVFKLHLIK